MEALQQLRDVHVPLAPGWWPPAPGWWLLALVLLVGIGALIWYWRQRRDRRRPFRVARTELDALMDAHRAGGLDAAPLADACSQLLKRLHLHAMDRADVAALSGRAWLDVIDAHLLDADERSAAQAFGDARFSSDFDMNADRVTQLTQALIGRLEKAA